MFLLVFFFFKQKTAYEMRISDWSSDVCSSDLGHRAGDDVAEHAAEVGFDHVAQVAARAHRRERGGDTAAHRRAVRAAGQSAEQGREQDGPVNRDRKSVV